jgi:hypothetical protein
MAEAELGHWGDTPMRKAMVTVAIDVIVEKPAGGVRLGRDTSLH